MEIPTHMTSRQRVRLVLSNLLQANLALSLARRELAADPGADTARKHEAAKAAAAEVRDLARRLVDRFGNAKDRARLAALLDMHLLWLMVLPLAA